MVQLIQFAQSEAKKDLSERNYDKLIMQLQKRGETEGEIKSRLKKIVSVVNAM